MQRLHGVYGGLLSDQNMNVIESFAIESYKSKLLQDPIKKMVEAAGIEPASREQDPKSLHA